MVSKVGNLNDLSKLLQPKIEKVLENVSKQLAKEFEKYINAEIYENNKDKLSKNILSSLKSVNYMTKSTYSGAEAKIFIDKDIINNLKDKDGNIIDVAINNSELSKFTDYCNKNYGKLFKLEMKKLGIPIR